jgi:hypothetical protein
MQYMYTYSQAFNIISRHIRICKCISYQILNKVPRQPVLFSYTLTVLIKEDNI